MTSGEFYEIPYRTMVRCISVSFILEASMRIQPTCMSIGEAVGIAAAWAKKHNIQVNALDWNDIPAAERSYVSKM